MQFWLNIYCLNGTSDIDDPSSCWAKHYRLHYASYPHNVVRNIISSLFLLIVLYFHIWAYLPYFEYIIHGSCIILIVTNLVISLLQILESRTALISQLGDSCQSETSDQTLLFEYLVVSYAVFYFHGLSYAVNLTDLWTCSNFSLPDFENETGG